MSRYREPRRWVAGAGCRGWPWKSGRRRSGIFCRPGEHRRPRDTGGTHPGRSSCVWNVVIPSGSGQKSWVREADREEGRIPWRAADDPRSECRCVERRQETGEAWSALRRPSPDNWPDTGRGARTRKGADVGQVSLCGTDDEDPEPKGKLDTVATQPTGVATAVAAGVGVVNGPEGEDLDWHAIDWRAVEADVRRLRQRIFTASQAGDLKRVRSLQKLMLRSRSNTLLSVRRVTEVNAGRKTAGVDGEVVSIPQAKAQLAEWVQRCSQPWQARPVKRVYIPKRGSSGKRRPLGIPVITDRVLQARVVAALEPEWEARFEPRTYGFRPGRGCHDATEAIFHVARGANPTRRWVLDADLAAAFDQIDHSHLLGQLGTFPARGLIADWLKAGVIDKGRFAPTEEGTPQGGAATRKAHVVSGSRRLEVWLMSEA